MVTKKYIVADEMGLHARPVSLLVGEATKHTCEITISAKGRSVNLKSIMMVLSLAIIKGEEFTLTCVGEGAEEAMVALEKIVIAEKLV